ncbi:hypothetical protein [Bacillus pumilus]|uniref:hypothetical protein n=1 Tax=Bacillus pumilus TaxID=1408 RepID=UPI0011A798C8|nr:hypothetical protein [Bacillus pumilus]
MRKFYVRFRGGLMGEDRILLLDLEEMESLMVGEWVRYIIVEGGEGDWGLRLMKEEGREEKGVEMNRVISLG